MYIVRDKKSKAIIHINPAPLEQNLEDKDVYFQFNNKTMEIGKTDMLYLPEHFDINKNGEIIEILSEENLTNPDQPATDPIGLRKTLSQQITEGLITLSPYEKLVVEDMEERIVHKTLSEQVIDGLITLKPDQKIVGTGYDEKVVSKTLKEQVQDNIIHLSEIPELIENKTINVPPEELLQDELVTFDYYKKLKIDQFSQMAFDIRNDFLPDYKIQNALIGIYGETMEADIRTTIQVFRDEFYNLKKQVEEAKDMETIVAIRENYPREMIKAGT
jgi:hypothetical protein